MAHMWPRAARWRWLIGAVAVLVVSALIVIWARVLPGYDPYGWLVWGHLTVHGKLDTNGAPSWKPLPYLFTLPYALAGRDALYLWMTTAFAISLTGFVFAARIAFWLVAAPAGRRYAGFAAGLSAAIALLVIEHYPHSILSAESDTMVVALCLIAVDCILQRRYRWAFWVWWLAALGRPEVWAPIGLYGLWAWRARPRLRAEMTIGMVLIPLLWLGIPALTSHSAFSGATLAEHSPRALHGNKITGTIGRFLALNPTAVGVAALLAVLLAGLRRDRRVLLLAAGVILWMGVEIAFALHGWSAVPRYMYEAAGATAVLAGVAIGRIILELPDGARRLRPDPRLIIAGGLAALVVVAAFAGSLAPVLRGRVAAERRDLRGQRIRAHYISLLAGGIARLGAGRILACGQPNIGVGWQSILAWQLGTNVGVLYYSPAFERRHPHPIVNIHPYVHGWRFSPSNWTNATQASRCRGLTYRT